VSRKVIKPEASQYVTNIHGKCSFQHKYKKIIRSSKSKPQLQELPLHKSSKKNNSKENNECKNFFISIINAKIIKPKL